MAKPILPVIPFHCHSSGLIWAVTPWQSDAVNQLKIGSGCLLGQTVKTRTLAGLRLCEAIYSGKESLPRHEHERTFLYLVLQGVFNEH